jgi:hypothetical protein
VLKNRKVASNAPKNHPKDHGRRLVCSSCSLHHHQPERLRRNFRPLRLRLSPTHPPPSLARPPPAVTPVLLAAADALFPGAAGWGFSVGVITVVTVALYPLPISPFSPRWVGPARGAFVQVAHAIALLVKLWRSGTKAEARWSRSGLARAPWCSACGFQLGLARTPVVALEPTHIPRGTSFLWLEKLKGGLFMAIALSTAGLRWPPNSKYSLYSLLYSCQSCRKTPGAK